MHVCSIEVAKSNPDPINNLSIPSKSINPTIKEFNKVELIYIVIVSFWIGC
jgi:hypothetical protein